MNPLQQQQKYPRIFFLGTSMMLLASLAASISNHAASAFSAQVTKPAPPSPKQYGASEENHNDHEWDLLIYNDSVNTGERVARVLVQVAGRSEYEAYCTMNKADKNGVAVVDSQLRFEIAEFYNE